MLYIISINTNALHNGIQHVITRYRTNLFSMYSQMQWEQYVDHYCRDFPCLFTKPIAADSHVSMDEGKVIVLLYIIQCHRAICIYIGTSESSHITIAITPPHIMQWLLRKLEGKEVARFPIIGSFTDRLTSVIKVPMHVCIYVSNY